MPEESENTEVIKTVWCVEGPVGASAWRRDGGSKSQAVRVDVPTHRREARPVAKRRIPTTEQLSAENSGFPSISLPLRFEIATIFFFFAFQPRLCPLLALFPFPPSCCLSPNSPIFLSSVLRMQETKKVAVNDRRCHKGRGSSIYW